MSEDKRLSINPQSVYNGYHSSQRNMFSTCGVAVGLIGFGRSKIFKDNRMFKFLTVLASLVFIVSVSFGTLGAIDFYYFLENSEDDIKKNHPYLNLQNWKNYFYLSIFFICVLTVIFISFFYVKFK